MNTPEQQPGGWLEQRGFGGLDWASQKHSVVVVDAQGKVLEDFEIEHSALGWKKFREWLQPYGSIPFAIETSQGAAVEQLLEAGMEVYPLNPKSAQPPGFVKILGPNLIGFADFRGNRQLISTGNLGVNDRAALFMMDYPHHTRLKLLV